LQGEIAQFITKSIPVTLTQEQVKKVNKDYTRSGSAYVCYARGREFYLKYRDSDNDKAIEFFRKAIEIDPNYALARAGLADAIAYKAAYFKTGDRNSLSDALKAATEAVNLDSDCLKPIRVSAIYIHFRESLTMIITEKIKPKNYGIKELRIITWHWSIINIM
jgi:tetratricopeptide (TPR) repeat protein